MNTKGIYDLRFMNYKFLSNEGRNLPWRKTNHNS